MAKTQDELLAERYGVDFCFPGDFEVTSTGDLRLTSGTDGIRQVFARALITRPGELFWQPNYGIGIEDFLNLPASAGNIAEMESRIRTSLEAEPDVEEIEELTVAIAASGAIEVEVVVRLAGTSQNLSTTIGGPRA